MRFHEALTFAIEKYAKIRMSCWVEDKHILWVNEKFVDGKGCTFNHTLMYCMEYDWEILNKRLFKSLKVGEKFIMYPHGFLTKIPEHETFNAINQQGNRTLKISGEKEVSTVLF